MDEPPAIGRIMPIGGRGCEGSLGFLGWVHARGCCGSAGGGGSISCGLLMTDGGWLPSM
jgi:hypothetical protein